MEEIKEGKFYVYFIRENSRKAPNYKVGYSKNPIQRVQSLQTGHPYKLGLFGLLEYDTREEAFRMEQSLHKDFSKYKEQGEWFKWNNQIDQIMRFGQDYYINYIRFFS